MAISFNDDLSRMLSVQDFGVAATLTTVNSIVVTLNGIFDKALEEQENDGALPINADAYIHLPLCRYRSLRVKRGWSITGDRHSNLSCSRNY